MSLSHCYDTSLCVLVFELGGNKAQDFAHALQVLYKGCGKSTNIHIIAVYNKLDWYFVTLNMVIFGVFSIFKLKMTIFNIFMMNNLLDVKKGNGRHVSEAITN